MYRSMSLAIASCLLAASTGEAAVALSFNGKMASGPQQPIAVETPFSGSITYEPGAMDLKPDDVSQGFYEGAVTSYTLTIGSYTINETKAPIADSRIDISVDGAKSLLALSITPFDAPRLNGFGVIVYSLTLAADGISIDPNRLGPLPFGALFTRPGSLGEDGFQLKLSNSAGNLVQQGGSLLAVTPLPADLPLMATGAGLLGWLKLRRASRRADDHKPPLRTAAPAQDI